MSKSTIFFLILFSPLLVFSQKKESEMRKNQVILNLDNDAFIIGRRDRYYSAGHFLDFFHYLGDGKSFSLGIGNQIYTPDLPKELPQILIERPFAGILYVEPGFQIRKERWFYEVKILGGQIGPKSKAGQFQRWYHDSFNLPPVYGWENQIEDSWITNLSVTFIHSLIDLGRMEVLIGGNTKFGNLEKSISLSPSIRFGKFQALNKSQVSGSRVGTTQRQEQYFHLGANLHQVFYNRTLDGKSQLPNEIPSFESKQGVGEFFGEFVLNFYHMGLSYGVYYRTKENQQATNQVYARIGLSWLFK